MMTDREAAIVKAAEVETEAEEAVHAGLDTPGYWEVSRDLNVARVARRKAVRERSRE